MNTLYPPHSSLKPGACVVAYLRDSGGTDQEDGDEIMFMTVPKFRPDLTDYRPYIQALTDKLNEDGLFKMSDTDTVKLAIEKAVKDILPDVVIVKKRKIYQRLNF